MQSAAKNIYIAKSMKFHSFLFSSLIWWWWWWGRKTHHNLPPTKPTQQLVSAIRVQQCEFFPQKLHYSTLCFTPPPPPGFVPLTYPSLSLLSLIHIFHSRGKILCVFLRQSPLWQFFNCVVDLSIYTLFNNFFLTMMTEFDIELGAAAKHGLHHQMEAALESGFWRLDLDLFQHTRIF